MNCASELFESFAELIAIPPVSSSIHVWIRVIGRLLNCWPAGRLSGRSSATVAFGTEGPYLNSMGMETVILGPGDIDQAHKADEFLLVERIPPMLEILSKMIGYFCIEELKHAN